MPAPTRGRRWPPCNASTHRGAHAWTEPWPWTTRHNVAPGKDRVLDSDQSGAAFQRRQPGPSHRHARIRANPRRTPLARAAPAGHAAGVASSGSAAMRRPAKRIPALCRAPLLCIALGCFAAEPPPLMQATVYPPGAPIDVASYWVSEKLDGVRGYWDGERLLTRSGRAVAAPEWFTAGWPAVPLDGEL